MDWRVKGLIEKSLSSMPGGRSLNDRLSEALGHFDSRRATFSENCKTGGCHLAICGTANFEYLARRFSRLARVGTQLCRFVSASPEPNESLHTISLGTSMPI